MEASFRNFSTGQEAVLELRGDFLGGSAAMTLVSLFLCLAITAGGCARDLVWWNSSLLLCFSASLPLYFSGWAVRRVCLGVSVARRCRQLHVFSFSVAFPSYLFSVLLSSCFFPHPPSSSLFLRSPISCLFFLSSPRNITLSASPKFHAISPPSEPRSVLPG